MNHDPTPGVIDGRQAYTDALRAALMSVPGQPSRQLWMIDDAFAAWPLDDPAVLQTLSQWLRLPGRQIHMIGGDFDAVTRAHPRFAHWRRGRVHVFDAWQPLEIERHELSARLLAGHLAVELLDREHWRARVVSDPASLRAMAEDAGSLLHRCESAWPVTTLGL